MRGAARLRQNCQHLTDFDITISSRPAPQRGRLRAFRRAWEHGAGISWFLGAILGPAYGHLGAILGPSWAMLGPSWGLLGPSWGHLAAILGYLGAIWGHLGSSWGHLGPSWDHLEAHVKNCTAPRPEQHFRIKCARRPSQSTIRTPPRREHSFGLNRARRLSENPDLKG